MTSPAVPITTNAVPPNATETAAAGSTNAAQAIYSNAHQQPQIAANSAAAPAPVVGAAGGVTQEQMPAATPAASAAMTTGAVRGAAAPFPSGGGSAATVGGVATPGGGILTTAAAGTAGVASGLVTSGGGAMMGGAAPAAPVQNHFASASLYVGDLDPDVNEMMLFEMFSAIGPVASVRVCRETGTRKSLGYAYVNYGSISDAERSLDTLNYTPIKGIPCRIMWSHRDPALRRSGAGNIFVKNLDKIIDNKALHDTFSLFGNILSCKVATDEYGKSKGYGFVHYETGEAARSAMEKVNGMMIGSKAVYVGPFKKQQDRPDGRSTHFTNLYVKDFNPAWTEDVVRSVFEVYGTVTSMHLSRDSKGRLSAMVNYESNEFAKKAIEELHGRRTTPTGVLPRDNDETSKVAVEDKTGDDETGEAKKLDGDSSASAVDAGGDALKSAAETTVASNSAEPEKAVADNQKQTSKTSAAMDAVDDSSGATAGSAAATTKEIPQDGGAVDPSDKSNNAQAADVAADSTASAHPTEDKIAAKDAAVGSVCTNDDESKDETAAKDIISTGHAHNDDIRLYVVRAMSKGERVALLKEAFNANKDSNRAKNQGVNLYVKNLDDSVRDDELRAAFSKFGTVTSSKIMKDEMGASKGFGFVCFETPDEATKAVTAMHLKIFRSKPLYVGLAEKRENRSARLKARFRMAAPVRHVPPPPQQMMAGPQGGIPYGAQALPPSIYSQPLSSRSGGGYHEIWRQQPSRYQQAGQPPQQPVYPELMRRAAAAAPLARPPPGQQQQQQQNFKFTSQARNRQDFHHPPPPPAAGAHHYAAQQHNMAVMMPRAPPGSGPGAALVAAAAAVEQHREGGTSAGDLMPLSAQTLAGLHPQMQKQMLGERIFPLVHKHQPELAGKITGMMLEMDNAELLSLLESEILLQAKVNEALGVLHRHRQGGGPSAAVQTAAAAATTTTTSAA